MRRRDDDGIGKKSHWNGTDEVEWTSGKGRYVEERSQEYLRPRLCCSSWPAKSAVRPPSPHFVSPENILRYLGTLINVND